ncbi:MAG: mechanosensitive ion channel [Halieaceae bacterium]|nr:mechanosensitive ion channel [Halieaceae bacterium]MCP5203873.1 mechanosensitive ion channel [Pseudomonadales bacterium]
MARAGRYLVILLSLPVLFASLAAAQAGEAGFDPYPLRPADTSSPRDTLQTFLADSTTALDAWRLGAVSLASARALERALDTLDFSATPYSNSYVVRQQRMLLLREVLDRIAIPPEDVIPGDSEVATAGITEWALPDTPITIVRLEDGPRAGEFLFSADTVEQLDRLYRKARELPYKAGALAGIYDAWEDSSQTPDALERAARARLRQVDTSSPRSTLMGFLDSVNRAYALVKEADAKLLSKPPAMTQSEALKIEAQAQSLLQRAVMTLDLGQVPNALREDVGIETVLALKEIFDRRQLPPLDSIPDAKDVAEARRSSSGLFPPSTGPLYWRFPDTEIEIVQIVEGEKQGQFLFSADTVSKVKGYYEKVRDLDYRKQVPGTTAADFEDVGHTTEGFFDYYISTPGYLLAPAHYYGRLVNNLPPWFKAMYHEQTYWQWIGLLVSVVLAIAISIIIFRLFNWMRSRLKLAVEGWLMVLPPVGIALIAIAVVDFINHDLNITGSVVTVVRMAGNVIVIVMMGWGIFNLCKAVAETVIASPRIHDQSLDATLWRVCGRILGFLLAAWIVIDGIRDLGADLLPVLAGLGVGGLAVALAAQKTLANYIGSLILFANRPVRVGDFCRYGDQVGTVESIGLISTRIRSLERTIVTVPNAEFSEMKLENFAMRDRRLFKVTLQLRYETTHEQMQRILEELRELLMGHPAVDPDVARVRFVGFGTYSKNLEVFTYLCCQDQGVFLALQEDLLLRMETIIDEAGSGFAFPSQTNYVIGGASIAGSPGVPLGGA